MSIKTEEPLYSISTAAKILNISVHTLRMYEREGLIIPFRKQSGHRLFSQSDINRLVCIRHSINSDKLSIAGIKTLYSLIPCWDIKECSDDEKNKCESFLNHSRVCWTFKHSNNKCSEAVCRDCVVYKEYADCGKIKESIIERLRKKEKF